MTRRLFILSAAGLLVPVRAHTINPFGFWKVRGASNGFDPTPYGTLVAWWKADSFSLTDGTAIGGTGNEWLDQSGHSNSLTQATGASQPVFKTAIVNSNPVIRFDGSDDFLSMASTISIGSTGAFTYMVVMAQTAANGVSIGGNAATGNAGLLHDDFSSGVVDTFGSGGGSSSTAFSIARTSFKLVIAKRASGASTVSFRENITAKGGSGTTGAIDATTLGARSNASLNFLKGDIAEVLIYTTEVSNTDCDTIYNSYLKPKYGLP